MNTNKLSVMAGFATAVSAATAQADLIVTYAENPGAVNSSLSDTQVLNWSGDSAFTQTGVYNNVSWSGVGTINQVYLQSANQYGGATGKGFYPVQSNPKDGGAVGGSSAIETTTLTVSTPSSYFGFWWSAGDGYNKVTFLNGNSPIASFTTQSLLDVLPSTYDGNPTAAFHGKDGNEPFAFINFFGTKGLSWTSVQFTDTSSSGFESDNWTSRVDAWGKDPNVPSENGKPLPGVTLPAGVVVVPAPEPANLLAGLAVSLVFISGAIRARTRRLNTGAL